MNRFSVGVVGAAFMIAAAGCSSSDVAVDDVEETVASVVEASEPEEISEETEASEETGTESDSSETSATETDDESSSGQATDTAQTSGTETDQPSSSSDSQESETTTSVEAMEPESDQGEDSESVFYLTTLWSLTIEEEQPRSGYDRDSWPHWRDTNGTGCDSRKDLLIMYAYKNNDEGDETIDVTDCVVVDGMWFSWYDATETSNSSSLDVDHIVSLAEAHDSGGANWSRSQKQEFANYLGNLILTSASTNRSKSDKDLGEWKPPYQAVWCVTAQQTVAVKSMFGLSVDQREHDALEEMLDTCNAGGQTSWRHASAYSSTPAVTTTLPPQTSAPTTTETPATTTPPETTAPPTTTTPPETTAPPTTTTPPETTAAPPGNPGDSKNCGDFDSYSEAKSWFDTYFPYYGDVARLDADGDGEPCESLPGGP